MILIYITKCLCADSIKQEIQFLVGVVRQTSIAPKNTTTHIVLCNFLWITVFIHIIASIKAHYKLATILFADQVMLLATAIMGTR
jgi:hypothetical protein